MLRPAPVTSTRQGVDDQRKPLDLSPAHVSDLGRGVHDLIHSHSYEIYGHNVDNRTVSRCGHPNLHTYISPFAVRRFEYPIRPELFIQSLGESKRTADIGPGVLAEIDNRRIPAHLFKQGFPESLPELDLPQRLPLLPLICCPVRTASGVSEFPRPSGACRS